MPAMADLDRLEGELDDVEAALACLSRTEPDLCAACTSARDDGSLSGRPALWACAGARLDVTATVAPAPAVQVPLIEAAEIADQTPDQI